MKLEFFFHSAAINVDPSSYNGTLDYYDPRTNQVWDTTITEFQKESIRKEIIEKQTAFIEKIIEKLKYRNNTQPMFLIFANALLVKGCENPILNKFSYYGRMKAKMTLLLENNRIELNKKNVKISNVYIGFIDTNMFNIRKHHAIRLQRIVENICSYLPINDEIVKIQKPLEKELCGEFFAKYFVGLLKNNYSNIDRFTLFKEKHLNFDDTYTNFISYCENRTKYFESLLNVKIDNKTNNEIEINKKEEFKNILINLCNQSIVKFCNNNNSDFRKINLYALKNANIIIDSILDVKEKLSLEDILSISHRIEKFFP